LKVNQQLQKILRDLPAEKREEPKNFNAQTRQKYLYSMWEFQAKSGVIFGNCFILNLNTVMTNIWICLNILKHWA